MIDMADKSSVLLISRDFMLKISNDLLDELSQLSSFLGCSLNQSKLNEFLRDHLTNETITAQIEEQELIN